MIRRSFVASGLALLSSAVAGAQAAPPANRTPTYVYIAGTDTIGIETLTITDSSIAGVLALTGRPRIEWHQARVGATGLGPLSLKVFAPGSAADAAPAQRGTIRVDGDSVRVEISANGQQVRQVAPTKAGAVVLVNASVVHAALLGVRAQRLGQSMIDIFLSSGGQTISGTVKTQGDTVVVGLPNSESRVLVGANGLPRSISVPGQKARVELATGPVTLTAPQASTPLSYEAPPGAPYTAEQVRIPTVRGYELAATLTRPRGTAPAPVVVTISGSGPQERDSRLDPVPDYAIFREVADTLGRRGIATLRFDDRGVGASGGLETAQRATTADFADDVRSVVAWLRTRPDIDPDRIALAGHSEGGIIAPLVASTDPRLRAIALLAGPAYTGRQIIMFQNRTALEAMPQYSRAQRDSILRGLPRQLDSAATTMPWVKYFLAHDPLATARLVKQPVLVLHGDTDRQVTPEQADTLAATMRRAGNANVTVRRFPATNHLFLQDAVGAATGYADLEDKRVRREVLGTLADWFVARLK